MVPKNLLLEQNDIRRERCLDFLELIENDDFWNLSLVVMRVEHLNMNFSLSLGQKSTNNQVKHQNYTDLHL